jgi:flagellar hook-length control protein FliK
VDVPIIAESGGADAPVAAGPGDAVRDIEGVREVTERPDPAAQPRAERPGVSRPRVMDSVMSESGSDVPEPPVAEARSPRSTAAPLPDLDAPETVERITGVASRLARALERAANPQAAPAADAAEAQTTPEFGQGDHAQPSLGDWLRDQVAPRASSGTRQAGVSPTFTLTAPAPRDARAGVRPGAPVDPVVSGAPVLPSDREITSQLIHSLRVQFRDGIGEAVLRLKPEHLGSLSISLRVENGGLKASVQAEVAQVRQWLESQQDTLRTALAEHGLRLDRFVVDSEGQRQNASRDPRGESSPRRRQPRHSAQGDQPAFEVVV